MKVCKVCSEQGLTSRLNIGCGTSTCMGNDEYYDEAGVYHYHDYNRHSMVYRCSNGHSYSVIAGTKCKAPGCDFGRDEEVHTHPTITEQAAAAKAQAVKREAELKANPPKEWWDTPLAPPVRVK